MDLFTVSFTVNVLILIHDLRFINPLTFIPSNTNNNQSVPHTNRETPVAHLSSQLWLCSERGSSRSTSESPARTDRLRPERGGGEERGDKTENMKEREKVKRQSYTTLLLTRPLNQLALTKSKCRHFEENNKQQPKTLFSWRNLLFL